MPELPLNWLAQLPVPEERERVANLFTRSLPAEALALEPMVLEFELNWELEQWLLDTCERYETSPEEVIEITVQLGRFIRVVYPRSETPGVRFFHAIIPVDYLGARMTAADQRASQYSSWQKSYVITLKEALEKKLRKLDEKLAPLLFDDESPEINETKSPSVRPLQPIDDLLPRVPREKSRRQRNKRSQALAGDLVHFLFEMGLKRGQPPHLLLKEIVQTARYIDVNFPNQQLPTLREQLLIKTLLAEKVALRLNRALSTLETVLVDLEASAQSFELMTLTLART